MKVVNITSKSKGIAPVVFWEYKDKNGKLQVETIMVDVESNPSIKCEVKGIVGFVPESERIYLRNHDESVIWCTWKYDEKPPRFIVGNQVEASLDEDIVAHIIGTSATWVEAYVEFENVLKGWSDVAEKVFMWYSPQKESNQ